MRKRLRMIYAATLAAVIARCGVTIAGMARSRKAECCLARAVLVLTLLRLGITEPTVRELTGMSQQRVNYIKNTLRSVWRTWRGASFPPEFGVT